MWSLLLFKCYFFSCWCEFSLYSVYTQLYLRICVLKIGTSSLPTSAFQDTNWARKREHTDAGNMLHQLEGEWLELVGKNYAVERACAELETEVEKLETVKKEKIFVLPDSSTSWNIPGNIYRYQCCTWWKNSDVWLFNFIKVWNIFESIYQINSGQQSSYSTRKPRKKQETEQYSVSCFFPRPGKPEKNRKLKCEHDQEICKKIVTKSTQKQFSSFKINFCLRRTRRQNICFEKFTF